MKASSSEACCGGQLEDGQVGLPGGGADLLRGQPLHVQDVGLVAGHGDVRAEQQLAERGRPAACAP